MATASSSSSSSSSSKILLSSGISGLSFGASGLLLKLAIHPLAPDCVRAQAVVALFFLTLVAGEATAFYALLLSKQLLVPTVVSPGLAKKLFWVPMVPFLLALALEVPALVALHGDL